jgi:putative SOS response-associated peptidase YedK
MCVDLSFFSTIEVMADYLPQLSGAEQTNLLFQPTYHAQAHAHVRWPIVINDDGCLKVKAFEWGMLDESMKDLAPKDRAKRRLSMVNARSERVFGEKWSVWYRLRQQRCLIPAQGFYEHKEIEGRKQPYFIKVKEQPLFFVAGLYHYSPFADVETGESKGTFTMFTRKANSLMEEIHNSGDNKHRMPLILSIELGEQWLAPNLSDKEVQEIMNYEFPSEAMEAWPVRKIRGIKEDNEKVIEAIELPTQTDLFG